MEVRVEDRRRDVDTRGLIFWDVVQWTLPDLLSIDASFLHETDDSGNFGYLISPEIPLARCDWRLRVYPEGRKGLRGWMTADIHGYGEDRLRRFSVLGSKRADGVVEESFIPSSVSGKWDRFPHLLIPRELEKRRSELMPSGAFTITCRVFRDDANVVRPLRVLEAVRPFGVMKHFSESVWWTIPNFLSIDEDSIFRSPPFTLAGCRWRLSACTTRDRRHLSVYVRREDLPAGTAREGGSGRVETAFHVGLVRGYFTVKELKSGTTGDFIVEGPEFSWGWPAFASLDELRRLKGVLLDRDTHSLHVSFRVEHGGTSGGVVAPTPSFKRRCGEDVPGDRRKTAKLDPEIPSASTQGVPGPEEKCDVTFEVQGRQFRANRSLLSARSEVFRATFAHDTAEAQTGVLTIPDCDPDTFGEFLHFLYTGRLREVSQMSSLSLYATSDKYDVQRLKKFCADYMAQTLTAENVCAVVALADLHSDERLATSAQHFFGRHHLQIVRTSAWSRLCEENPSLAEKLQKEMTAAPAENPRYE